MNHSSDWSASACGTPTKKMPRSRGGARDVAARERRARRHERQPPDRGRAAAAARRRRWRRGLAHEAREQRGVLRRDGRDHVGVRVRDRLAPRDPRERARDVGRVARAVAEHLRRAPVVHVVGEHDVTGGAAPAAAAFSAASAATRRSAFSPEKNDCGGSSAQALRK